MRLVLTLTSRCSLETRTLTLSVSQAHACLLARAFFLGPTARENATYYVAHAPAC